MRKKIARALFFCLIVSPIPRAAAAPGSAPAGGGPAFPEVVAFQLGKIHLLTPQVGLSLLRNWASSRSPDFAADRTAARLLLSLIADPARIQDPAIKGLLSPIVGDLNMADIGRLAGQIHAIANHNPALANALADIREEFSFDPSDADHLATRLDHLFDKRALVPPTVFAAAPETDRTPHRGLDK